MTQRTTSIPLFLSSNRVSSSTSEEVSGSPGSNMVYRPPTPLKIDASHLIGGRVQDVNVTLVDQHGNGLTSLLGEKFSTVIVLEYDV